MSDVLTKKALIESVAELNDVTKREAEKSVDSVIDTIKDALIEGMSVNIHGFGVFSVKDTIVHSEKRHSLISIRSGSPVLKFVPDS